MPLLAMAVVGFVGLGVGGLAIRAQSRPRWFDAWFTRWNGLSGRSRSLAEAVNWLGEPAGAGAVTAAIALVCVAFRRPALGVLVLASVPSLFLVTTAVKHLVGRPIDHSSASYPSGHVAMGTAIALVLAILGAERLMLRQAAAVAVLIVGATAGGAVTAWAQIGIRNHYPTDTLGGYAAALLVVPVLAWVIGGLARLRRCRAGPVRRARRRLA